MTCALCSGAIEPDDAVNLHHPVYRSEGGRETEPTHKRCHVAFHENNGDFRYFGRIGGQISALDKHWAFTLNNVKSDPAYDCARAFNIAFYQH